ncbi:MAG: TIGR03086 family metal-binding protein [Mycobacterium sp.]
MYTNVDLRATHRMAVLASMDAVSSVTPADLSRPTPCAGWNLADLLAHMTVQHRGFAAAANGQGADPAVWQPATVADAIASDPAVTYAAAADAVLEAFAGPDVMNAGFALPELAPEGTFPGSMAIGFHLVDYVVHTWDVARTMGHSVDLPAEVVAAALPLAFAVPDGDFRAGADAFFGPAVQPSERVDDLDRILAYLGRSAEWAPAR